MSLIAADQIDYGEGNVWIHVKDVCLDKQFPGTGNNGKGYKYTFCFFNSVKQDHVLLGKYAGWGKKGKKNQ